MRKYLLIAVMGLTGCAALRVDVDVYKGPLLNEQSIQQQQLVSMVLASKILIESQVDAEECTKKKESSKTRCKLLDEILSLYGRAGGELANNPTMINIGRLLEEYQTATRKHKDDFSVKFPIPLDVNDPTLKALVNYTWTRGQTDPTDALNAIRKQYKPSNLVLGANSNLDLIELIKNGPNRALFSAPLQSLELNGKFQVHLDRYSKSIIGLKTKLEDLYGQIFSPALVSSRFVENVSIKERIENLQNFFVLEGVQNRNLACGLALTSGNPDVEQFKKILTTRFETSPMIDRRTGRQTELTNWTVQEHRSADDQLKALLGDPKTRAVTILALKAADAALRLAEPQLIKSRCVSVLNFSGLNTQYTDLGALYSKPARQYGVIATSLSLDSAGQLVSTNNYLLAFAGEVADVLSGVKGGREVKGIDELSRDFISESKQDGSQPSFTNLSRAITNFGERLRYLSVNWWLLGSERDQDAKEFKTVLEAIGNALISQTNEVTAYESYKNKDSGRTVSEADAIAKAFPSAPKDLIASLDRFLNGRLEALNSANAASEKQTKLLAIQAADVTAVKTEVDNAQVALDTNIALRLSALAVQQVAAGEKSSLVKLAPDLLVAMKKSNKDLNVDALKAELLNLPLILSLKLKNWKAETDAAMWLALVNEQLAIAKASSLTSARTQILDSIVKSSGKYTNGKAVANQSKFVNLESAASTFMADGKSEIDLAKNVHSDAVLKFQTLTEKLKTSEQSTGKNGVPIDIERYIKAIALIKSHGQAFVTASEKNKSSTPLEILGNLRRYLIEKDAVNATVGTLQTIDEYTALSTKTGGATTPQTHLDALYAALSHQLIQTVATQGAASSQASNLRDAMKQVKERKGELTYIRPAVSYLRSIHNTILSQSQAGLEWRNMLNDGAVKAIPFIGSKIWNNSSGGGLERSSSGPFPDTNPRALAEQIDKTYWQTINSVKLSAAGTSNFVVAKDDVGNWYVKAVGADPGKMLNSARNLLLFNSGIKIDQNLLELNDLRAQRRSETDPDKLVRLDNAIASNQATTKAGGAALEAVLSKYRDKYSEALRVEFENVKTIITTKSIYNAALSAVENSGKDLSNGDLIKVKAAIKSNATFEVDGLFDEKATSDVRRAQLLNSGLAKHKDWLAEAKSAVDKSGVLESYETKVATAKANEVLKKGFSDTAWQKFKAATEATRTELLKLADAAQTAAETAATEANTAQDALALQKLKLTAIKSALEKVITTDFVLKISDRRKTSIKETEKAVLILSEAADLD